MAWTGSMGSFSSKAKGTEMKISSAFPSTYLKAADLQDRNITVTIDRVEMEDIGSDHKPVIYFQGKEKGLVLNRTNSNNIAAVYGDETADWAGKEITLYPTIVDFQGRSVDAIRVRAPQKRIPPGGNGPQKPSRELVDDTEIPF